MLATIVYGLHYALLAPGNCRLNPKETRMHVHKLAIHRPKKYEKKNEARCLMFKLYILLGQAEIQILTQTQHTEAIGLAQKCSIIAHA